MAKSNKRKNIYIALTLMPVLLVASVIFMFSAQKAEASSEVSGSMTDSFITLAIPGFDKLDGTKQKSIIHNAEVIIRKAAHFSEFAALGFFVFLHFNLYIKRKPWLLSWLVSSAYAVSDEVHQFFVAERAPRALDVLIDSGGAIFGIGVLALILHYIGKRRAKR